MNNLYEDLLCKREAISVIGLGYVGMPLAIELAKHFKVVGFDLNQDKVEEYRQGHDATQEVGDEALKESTAFFSSDPAILDEAQFHIIAVPTPINMDKTPDFSPLIGASKELGKHLRPGAMIVYESTVYPGATEEICAPCLEKTSGLKCGEDFWIGYSPERINPADKTHTLRNIRKVVSGLTPEATKLISSVYEKIIDAGVFQASNIKTAEAIKVVENSQRDINIAFMNEIAMVFDLMGISTSEVVDGMNTKWNALGFTPGLVGGHCIGVDPYYFTYNAENLGYHSQIILSGRKINDSMGQYIADIAIRELVKAGYAPKDANVAVLGLTFKENCPDTRNSKSMDIVRRLNEYGVYPAIVDPYLTKAPQQVSVKCNETQLSSLRDIDCIILAVAHDEFGKELPESLETILSQSGKPNIIIDVKSMLNKDDLAQGNCVYWSL